MMSVWGFATSRSSRARVPGHVGKGRGRVERREEGALRGRGTHACRATGARAERNCLGWGAVARLAGGAPPRREGGRLGGWAIHGTQARAWALRARGSRTGCARGAGRARAFACGCEAAGCGPGARAAPGRAPTRARAFPLLDGGGGAGARRSRARGVNGSTEPRLSLSGSWQQGHSAAYSTPFLIRVVCRGSIGAGP